MPFKTKFGRMASECFLSSIITQISVFGAEATMKFRHKAATRCSAIYSVASLSWLPKAGRDSIIHLKTIKKFVMETTTEKPMWYVASEVELVYKTKVKNSERPHISKSRDVYQLLKTSWDENKLDFVEQFKVIFLNRANKVLGIFELATGGLSGVIADPRLIFAAAIKTNAISLILAHNHPSGALKPSKADLDMTEKIRQAGRLLDILVADHMILTAEGYYSFADEGLL
jgi:DNA repair protein RadC